MKRPSLESIANLAIILASIIVALSYVVPQRGSRVSLQAVARGDTLPVIQDMGIDKAETSVVVVARESCPYCVESMPFYKSLTAAARPKRAQGQLQIVFVTTDPIEVATQYLAAGGVDVDKIVSITSDELEKLKIQGTPTVLLVNRNRTIREVWVGKLTSERERAALATLGLT